MVPIIGITCHHDYVSNKLTLNKSYINVLEKYGAVPLILPEVTSLEIMLMAGNLVDGLLLAGGVDVDPRLFGEQPIGTQEITPERDNFEMTVLGEFLARDKPVLAVCRGLQVLNICAGGDIYQDINSQRKRVIKHMQQAPKWYPSHTVTVKEGSKLQQITGCGQLQVNSYHHQASRTIAPGFEAVAWSGDGIVEAVESLTHDFVIGVQWHPELMTSMIEQRKLFQAFIQACCKKGEKDDYRI